MSGVSSKIEVEAIPGKMGFPAKEADDQSLKEYFAYPSGVEPISARKLLQEISVVGGYTIISEHAIKGQHKCSLVIEKSNQFVREKFRTGGAGNFVGTSFSGKGVDVNEAYENAARQVINVFATNNPDYLLGLWFKLHPKVGHDCREFDSITQTLSYNSKDFLMANIYFKRIILAVHLIQIDNVQEITESIRLQGRISAANIAIARFKSLFPEFAALFPVPSKPVAVLDRGGEWHYQAPSQGTSKIVPSGTTAVQVNSSSSSVAVKQRTPVTLAAASQLTIWKDMKGPFSEQTLGTFLKEVVEQAAEAATDTQDENIHIVIGADNWEQWFDKDALLKLRAIFKEAIGQEDWDVKNVAQLLAEKYALRADQYNSFMLKMKEVVVKIKREVIIQNNNIKKPKGSEEKSITPDAMSAIEIDSVFDSVAPSFIKKMVAAIDTKIQEFVKDYKAESVFAGRFSQPPPSFLRK